MRKKCLQCGEVVHGKMCPVCSTKPSLFLKHLKVNRDKVQAVNELECPNCGKVCKSRIGLTSHFKACKPSIGVATSVDIVEVVPETKTVEDSITTEESETETVSGIESDKEVHEDENT